MSRFTRFLLVAAVAAPVAGAQTQKIDQEYTAKIKQELSDPRISTELVDHLPASATVPTTWTHGLVRFGK